MISYQLGPGIILFMGILVLPLQNSQPMSLVHWFRSNNFSNEWVVPIRYREELEETTFPSNALRLAVDISDSMEKRSRIKLTLSFPLNTTESSRSMEPSKTILDILVLTKAKI